MAYFTGQTAGFNGFGAPAAAPAPGFAGGVPGFGAPQVQAPPAPSFGLGAAPGGGFGGAPQSFGAPPLAPAGGGYGQAAPSFGGGGGYPATAATAAPAAADALPENEVDLRDAAGQAVMSLRWCPNPAQEALSAAQWHGRITVHTVSRAGPAPMATMVAETMIGGPILDTAWSIDGQTLYVARADGNLSSWNVATSSTTPSIGTHERGIRTVNCVNMGGSPIIITGGWDAVVKYWDVRQPNPVGILQCGERVYAADATPNVLAVATADRKVRTVDLRNPSAFLFEPPMKLRTQIRCVRILKDERCMVMSSIEGRCAIAGLTAALEAEMEPNPAARPGGDTSRHKHSFAFKCHRVEMPAAANGTVPPANLYPVNALDTNPHPEARSDIFVTGGGDGTISAWHKSLRRKFRDIKPLNLPTASRDSWDPPGVTSLAFGNTGDLLAYAIGDDYARGADYSDLARKRARVGIVYCGDAGRLLDNRDPAARR